MASPAPIAQVFTFEGRQWQMIFNFEVIAAFEESIGVSIIDVVAPAGGGRPMISRLARLLMFALLPAQPDVTLDDAGRMMADAKVQALFTGQVAAAMPQGSDTGEDGETPPANPPLARAKRSGGKTG
jgi:hypothetical protein